MAISARKDRRRNVKDAKYIAHLRMNEKTKIKWNILASRMEQRTGLSLSNGMVLELLLEPFA